MIRLPPPAPPDEFGLPESLQADPPRQGRHLTRWAVLLALIAAAAWLA